MAPSDDEITTVAGDIWLTVLGLGLLATGPSQGEPLPDDVLTSSVTIDGSWRGAVLLQCSKHFAKRAACLMFGLDATDVGNSEVNDALGELANMISGNVKALLPGPCRLSLPLVAEGPAKLPSTDRVIERQLWFDCEADLIVLRVVSDAAPQREASA
jgi:chemotaxis protein CheX